MGLFDKLRGNEEEEVELKPREMSSRSQQWGAKRRRASQGSDSEVELRDNRQSRGAAKPPKQNGEEETVRSRYGQSSDSSNRNDQDDEFLLPGMKKGSESSRGKETPTGQDEQLSHIMEQNNRIIELLEEIAGAGESEDRADTEKDTGSDNDIFTGGSMWD